jgi:hypothetical protein
LAAARQISFVKTIDPGDAIADGIDLSRQTSGRDLNDVVPIVSRFNEDRAVLDRPSRAAGNGVSVGAAFFLDQRAVAQSAGIRRGKRGGYLVAAAVAIKLGRRNGNDHGRGIA